MDEMYEVLGEDEFTYDQMYRALKDSNWDPSAAVELLFNPPERKPVVKSPNKKDKKGTPRVLQRQERQRKLEQEARACLAEQGTSQWAFRTVLLQAGVQGGA